MSDGLPHRFLGLHRASDDRDRRKRVRWRLPPSMLAALVPVLLLAVWLGFATTRPFALGVRVTLYVLANLIVFIDGLDLILRVAFRWRQTGFRVWASPPTSIRLDVGTFTPYQMKLHLRPYALVVSVHNVADEIDDFLESLAPFRDRLWVIDDASSDDTWIRLQQAGVHCVRGSTNRKKPGAIRELLAHLPADVATVVVLDPDVRILDGHGPLTTLDRVIFDFQRSGKAAVTPRVVVRKDGWLARLQNFEYAITCSIGRKSLADHGITSGVAIYRHDALAMALHRHNLSVYAEDFRNALILLGQGESIYHDERLVFETEGKRTWGAWFSQRVGWFYGLLKVYAEQLSDVRRCAHGGPFYFYQFVVYIGVFAVLFHPFRLVSLGLLALSTINGAGVLLGLDWIPGGAATPPALFLAAYLKYTALALVASTLVVGGPREWLSLVPAVPIYFFYALALTLPATFGYLNWLSLRLGGGRIYRDHYETESSVRRNGGGDQ